MENQDLPSAILALSARVSVIECAVAALAPKDEYERQVARANFKRLAGELLDQNLGLPVDERYLQLLRQSLEDVGAMLESGRSDQQLPMTSGESL